MLNTKTEDKQTLYQHLLNTMPTADFNTLSEYFGVSQRLVTVRLRNAKKMPFGMIVFLAQKMGVSGKYLIEEFEAGADALTGIEREHLMKEKGLPRTD